MRIRTLARLIASSGALLGPRALAAQDTSRPDVTPYLMERDAEVRLARSAAPAPVAESATVLVLGRIGFVEAVPGTNGFVCVVMRSMSGPLDGDQLWKPRIRSPQCLNAPAARTVLPTMLKQTEWMLAGVKPAEIIGRLERAYAAHEFPSPAPGAMAYMLSPDQYLTDPGSHWLPHLMFFYDKSQPPGLWGAAATGGPVIDGSAADPHAPFLTLFVPVRVWSSGASAMAP